MANDIMSQRIASDETEVPGMKYLYADRSEAGRITYIKDIVYDVRSNIPLHMQMLYPELPPAVEAMQSGQEPSILREVTHRMPCVVYVQGSAWGPQNCYKSLPLLIDMARQGFVIASVEYRPATEVPFPGFVSDVKAAIRFLKANATLYGIDPKRIAVWGCSYGGHAALMVGATGWTREFDDGICLEQDSSVCACVSYYGVAEFRPFLADGKFPRDFLFDRILGEGQEHSQENAKKISPVTYIREEHNYPPFLLIHGDMDPIVPFEQSVFMYRQLKSCGKRAEIIKVQGAGHGNYFWTPEVLSATGQFLKAYV